MRLPKKEQETTKEQVLPLINIAFLLLIFFMIVGTLEPPDEVEPAESSSEQPIVDQGLILLVRSDGELSIGGEIITPEALVDDLSARFSAGEVPDVRVKPDARLSADRLVEVLGLLRAAEVRSVRLLTWPVTQ